MILLSMKAFLVLVISQSGETADTLAALREAKRLGARVISIVNVVGSSIANDSDDVLYTWAGPEIAVATTKAYSTQLAVVYLLALYLGEKRNTITTEQLERYVKGLENLPNQIQEILEHQETIQYLASQYFNSRDIFFYRKKFRLLHVIGRVSEAEGNFLYPFLRLMRPEN